MLAEWEGDVIEDGKAVEQGGALKHEAVAGAEVGQGPLAETGEGAALELHVTAGRPDQADHRLEQHSLSAAAFAEHDERLSRIQVDGDVLEHVLRSKPHGEPLDP